MGARLENGPRRYSLETSDNGISVYKILLNAFSAECGGADNGYIRVENTTVLGSRYTVVPFEVITAEK